MKNATQTAVPLTPEHLARLRRIADREKRSLAQVLADAVQEYWVRFASRSRLKAEEW